jgi:tetrahydromethanopterin S-methyltransferase subunit C
MEPMKLNMPSYPMLGFVARHGGWLAAVVALAVALGGIAVCAITGAVLFAILGIVAGVLVFIVARALVEMVRLITDMLLPK